jgi:hypothetical protein
LFTHVTVIARPQTFAMRDDCEIAADFASAKRPFGYGRSWPY